MSDDPRNPANLSQNCPQNYFRSVVHGKDGDGWRRVIYRVVVKLPKRSTDTHTQMLHNLAYLDTFPRRTVRCVAGGKYCFEVNT